MNDKFWVFADGSCKLWPTQLIWIFSNSIYFQAGSQQKAVYIKLINSENQKQHTGMRQEWLCDIKNQVWREVLYDCPLNAGDGSRERMFGLMGDHLIRLGSLLWPLTATPWIMTVNTMMQSDILILAHRRIDFEPNTHTHETKSLTQNNHGLY